MRLPVTNITIKRKRRLHFFQDEKVVNDTIENFEMVFHDENLFVVLSKDGKTKFVGEHPNTVFLSYKSGGLQKILKNSASFDEIICHSMWYELAIIICQLNHPNITWIVWGADLYEELLYPKGYKLYLDEPTLFKVRANKLPVFFYKLLINIRDHIHYRASVKVLSKVKNVCCGFEEYKLIKDYYPYFESGRKVLFYYPIEKMLDSFTLLSFVSGRDVWVNNAAAYNGNHVDIFLRLVDIEWDGNVHVPLSYGSKKYANYVCKEGRKILGERFDPMLKFVPKDEYYRKFLGSNAFIFGHLRQCAFGNIIIAFYLGAKVFLFRSNPLYHSFLSMGIFLYTIEEDLNKENLLAPLSDRDRQHNREIIQENYSLEKLISLLKENF